MADSRQVDQRRAYAYALVSVLCWSTVATAFKLSLRNLDLLQLLFYANATAALTLFTVAAIGGRLGALRDFLRSNWRTALGLGLLNPLVYYLVLFAAYDRLPAQVAQPLNYTWAITLSLLSVPLLGQRVGVREWLAAAIAYCGVVVITTGGAAIEGADLDLLGVFLALASTVFWSLYWIFNTRATGDPVVRLTANFLFALPATALLCLGLSDPFQVSAAGLAGAAWVGLLEMGLPFVTWQLALSYSVNTARVGNLIFLSPFLSLQFIDWVLDEPVQLQTYVGLGLILLGLLVQKR